MENFFRFATESDIAEIDDDVTMNIFDEELPEKDDDDDDVENAQNQWAAIVHDIMFRK